MGELALAGGRMDTQLRRYHNQAQCTVRRIAQSDAGGSGAGNVAGLARGGDLGPARLKALLAPYPSEGMTCWPVSPRVGNVKNNDPSLVEPVATQ
jgi:hypothetical protein